MTSYLENVKLSKILIKFPLIWYAVGICVGLGHNGAYIAGLNKEVHFLGLHFKRKTTMVLTIVSTFSEDELKTLAMCNQTTVFTILFWDKHE